MENSLIRAGDDGFHSKLHCTVGTTHCTNGFFTIKGDFVNAYTQIVNCAAEHAWHQKIKLIPRHKTGPSSHTLICIGSTAAAVYVYIHIKKFCFALLSSDDITNTGVTTSHYHSISDVQRSVCTHARASLCSAPPARDRCTSTNLKVLRKLSVQETTYDVQLTRPHNTSTSNRLQRAVIPTILMTTVQLELDSQ